MSETSQVGGRSGETNFSADTTADNRGNEASETLTCGPALWVQEQGEVQEPVGRVATSQVIE